MKRPILNHLRIGLVVEVTCDLLVPKSEHMFFFVISRQEKAGFSLAFLSQTDKG